VTKHLLPFFHRHYPLEITASEIDRLRSGLLAKGLSATSVNKCIRLLAQILDTAEDYGLIEANPARNRRRYAKRAPKRPVWLDRPEQISAMLDAAAGLDRAPTRQTDGREAFIAVLLLAGLRISEACELRWRALDFHNDLIRGEQVGKTAASFREGDLFPALRSRLESERDRREPPRVTDRVFYDLQRQAARQGQRTSARHRPRRRRGRRGPPCRRVSAAARRRHGAQAAPHVRVAADRDGL